MAAAPAQDPQQQIETDPDVSPSSALRLRSSFFLPRLLPLVFLLFFFILPFSPKFHLLRLLISPCPFPSCTGSTLCD